MNTISKQELWVVSMEIRNGCPSQSIPLGCYTQEDVAIAEADRLYQEKRQEFLRRVQGYDDYDPCYLRDQESARYLSYKTSLWQMESMCVSITPNYLFTDLSATAANLHTAPQPETENGTLLNLYMTCPECGGQIWKEAEEEDGGFCCNDCGEYCQPEQMGGKVVPQAASMKQLSFMLTLSTAHICPDTAELLDAEALDSNHLQYLPVYSKDEYGWFIYLSSYHLADKPQVPEDLRACIEYAQNLGCEILCLDRDGEQVEDRLPIYNWQGGEKMEQTYLERIEALYEDVKEDSTIPEEVLTEALETIASVREILWDYSAEVKSWRRQ